MFNWKVAPYSSVLIKFVQIKFLKKGCMKIAVKSQIFKVTF